MKLILELEIGIRLIAKKSSDLHSEFDEMSKFP